jgi:hypothetical protein
VSRAVLVLIALCGVASAESAPDSIADEEGAEANLESISPRSGLVASLALGGGLLVGGDIGVGRGGAFSVRVGHVATRRTVITFEVTGTAGFHQQGEAGPTASDSVAGLFAGALHYSGRSTFVRAAGGPVVFNANVGGNDPFARGGLGGLVGGGLDLLRWGYLVVGVEVFAMTSLVAKEGLKFNSGFSLGLTYY